jgi:hypothetical protein
VIEVDVEDGWLLVTAINRTNGEATTGTYALKTVGEGSGGRQRLVAIGMNEEDQDQTFVLTTRPAVSEPPEVEPYQELIRQMIAADEACPSGLCRVTMMGHLLARVAEPLRDLVKALDPDHQEEV